MVAVAAAVSASPTPGKIGQWSFLPCLGSSIGHCLVLTGCSPWGKSAIG
ncbi:hypothetical protein SAMN02745244_00430, partial [Tessaracoccus bendigoensis DSM 12906]